MKVNTIQDIREEFQRRKALDIYRGNGTIEIQNAQFRVTEDSIFGVPNQDYINAEIAWYESQNRNVYHLFDLYGKEVEIWKNCSSNKGMIRGEINSNYGWCVYSHENKQQYDMVYNTLDADPLSRQAVMIYTNPDMHWQSIRDGMKDFMCTNTVQYFLECPTDQYSNYLHAQVNMRSNDAVFGFMNDIAWQKHVLNKLANDLDVYPGEITWSVGSLHVYERHYGLIT